MNIGFKHSKVRLTLLATMVATTSALVAAPVQAGKAPPVFEDATIKCGYVPGQVIANFVVDGKGKWVNVDLELTVDGSPQPHLEWDAEKKDRTKPIEWNYNFEGQEVALKARLVDKKGEAFGVEGSTTDTLVETCS